MYEILVISFILSLHYLQQNTRGKHVKYNKGFLIRVKQGWFRVHMFLHRGNIILHGPARFDSQIVPSRHNSKGTELLLYRDTHRHHSSSNTSENALAGLLDLS